MESSNFLEGSVSNEKQSLQAGNQAGVTALSRVSKDFVSTRVGCTTLALLSRKRITA
jgi:hypothetical protein